MADAILQGAIFPLTEHIRREGKAAVRKHLLNVKDQKSVPIEKQLEMGDELCRARTTPMNSQLIKKVIEIYQSCDPSNREDDTTEYLATRYYTQMVKEIFGQWNPENSNNPLMKALEMGLMNMVWGFIECSKQTNSNLLTHDEAGDDEAVQKFLWLPETAFDVAIAKNQSVVASLLLKNAPVSCLESQWKQRGKTLIIPLFNSDPKFDRIIFDMLEKEKRGELTPPTSHQILDDSRQESIIDTESITNYSNPQPKGNKTGEFLRNLDHGVLGLNASKNTTLHLVSKSGDVKYVEEILEKHPSMISCHNSNGETPAYVAAREGHANILQIMFQYMKEKNEDNIKMIVTRTTDKHNALHIAIQNHHLEVVFFLIEQLPQLANHVNDYNESPIYLAAERKYSSVLELILKKCREINVAGPNGKTALHAAAISDSPECTDLLLNERRDLLHEKDEYGWTPFRYAVHHNSSLATAKLLNADYSLGYQLMREDDINTSAIHIAASQGYYETMEVLMSECVGCSEFIDDKGRNILHVAVENKMNKVIELIFQDESLTSLINQKDNNGNTPIHLLVASDF